MNIEEALELLEENGYQINEGKLTKALATGALAAGMAFGNSGIGLHKVKGNSVPNDNRGFGKTPVHLQHRYDYQDVDRFSIPKSFKLKNGDEAIYKMDHRDEVEMTMEKILSTPDSMLRKFGKINTQEIANLMVRTANKYNIDVDILLAIAGTESNFDHSAKSNKGARGMMQMTRTAALDVHHRIEGNDTTGFKFDNVTSLRDNIDKAGKLIADISKRRNNVIEMIFATYNGGTAQATAWRYEQLGKNKMDDGKPAPKLAKETRDYVQKCLKLYYVYKEYEEHYEG